MKCYMLFFCEYGIIIPSIKSVFDEHAASVFIPVMRVLLREKYSNRSLKKLILQVQQNLSARCIYEKKKKKTRYRYRDITL